MEKDAWIAWLGSFDSVQVIHLSALSDGLTLSNVMRQIDPVNLRCELQDTKSANWVAAFNNLKRIYRVLMKEANRLQLSEKRATPNLSSIAKDNDQKEAVKLLELILLVAMSGEQRNNMLIRIASLSKDQQMHLKKHIHKFIASRTDDGTKPQSETQNMEGVSLDRLKLLSAENEELRQCYAESLKKVDFLEIELERANEDNRALTEELKNLDKETKLDGSRDLELHLNRQYLDLHNQFLMTEDLLAHKVAQSAEQDDTIKSLRAELARVPHDTNDAATICKLQEELIDQAQVIASNTRLEVVNEKYRKKLSQNAAEALVYEERILQLEARNESLRHDLEKITSKMDETKKGIASLSLHSETSEIYCSESKAVVDVSVAPDELNLKDMPRHRSSDTESSLSHDLQEKSSASVCETEEQLEKGVRTPADRFVKGSAKTSDQVSCLERFISAQKEDFSMVKSYLPQEVMEELDITISQLWESREIDIRNLREKFERSHLLEEQQPSQLDRVAIGCVDQAADQVTDSCADYGIDHTRFRVPETQAKMMKLLKKQDALIKNYKKKYEDLECQNIDSVAKAEHLNIQEQFSMYRKKAEERELQFRQENSLVAKAFYDLAAKFAMQNKLVQQRSDAPPRTFLSTRRSALGVLSPSTSRPR